VVIKKSSVEKSQSISGRQPARMSLGAEELDWVESSELAAAE
jgi:hypothetical protein